MSEDHFNWPTASREPEEAGIARRTFCRERSPNLDISDIEKARPHYQGYQYTHKEVFINRNDDISGSHPKKLHQPLEKVYYNLKNDDIDGTKPKCQKFTTTRSTTNPLNPEYKLPKVEVRVPTPPKFIRDNISINDIDGAKPNPYTKYNIQRKTNNVEDIDGAKPKKEWLPQGKQSSLDVKDINSFWEFHTTRHTDPLSPRYRVIDHTNELVEYGKLDNKVMVRHPKEVKKPESSDLRTADIDGAQASTSTQHVTKIQTRDIFMKTQDIPGAQICTLKKGITTKRQLDPLWPVYTVPGHSEPPPVLTRNLRPDAFTKKHPTQSATNFAATTKTELVSPVENKPEEFARKIEFGQNNGDNIQADRRSSGLKTPASQGGFRSPLARTGEEVLQDDKNRRPSERVDYVPARIASKENVDSSEGGNQKNGIKGFTLETKKALNSNDKYQNNVKNFFGLTNGDEKKSYKPLSTAEKLDKYISK